MPSPGATVAGEFTVLGSIAESVYN